MLFFVTMLVFFRTRIRGRRLEMLENGMVFIILITRISSAPLTFPTTIPFFSESIKTNKEKVFLYHCRLGHPSFRVMKQLFPSLLKNFDVESLCCEVCELAKHKRVSFPVRNKISTSQFCGVPQMLQIYQVVDGL